MNPIEEIKNLKSLLDQGAIDKNEFQLLKNEIIAKTKKKEIGINGKVVYAQKTVVKKVRKEAPSSQKVLINKPAPDNIKPIKSKPIKTASWIISVLVVLYILGSLVSKSSTNCDNSRDDYLNGYASGKTVRLMGGSGTCDEYVNSFNYQTGRSSRGATDCFCKGYNDGIYGRESKYK